jgi:hypothetical protein
MKNFAAAALVAFAGLVSAGSLHAQQAVQANIPFDFAVGDTVMPAGVYQIAPSNSSFIRVRNVATHQTVQGMAIPDANGENGHGRLIFNVHNSQYFLSEIRCPGSSLNADLPTSRLEKRAHLQEAALQTPAAADHQVEILLAMK